MIKRGHPGRTAGLPGALLSINLEVIMDISDSFKLYLKDKEVYCSDKSCEYYNNMMHVFSLFLLQNKLLETEDLSSSVLKDFVLYLKRKGVKNTSIHTYMRAVKNYCSWGIINSIIPPFEYHIKLPRPDPDQVLPLSHTEVYQILDYIKANCSDPDNKELFFRLLLDCGLRSSEALFLERKDIDTDNKIIHINQSKYEKSRMIPLPEKVKGLIPDIKGKLFDFDISGKNSFFTRIKHGSGVSRIHAHLLRHTFATSYMVHVGNLEYLRMYLGHSSYDVTRNYIQSAYQCNLLHYDIYKIDDIFT